MDLTQDMGAMETIGKISPPILMVFVINIIVIALHKIIPHKFEMLLCVVTGVILYPSLIDPTTLIYSFPNTSVALVCYGIVGGFIAWLLQPKIKAMVKKLFGVELNGHNADTQFLTRSAVAPAVPPANQDTASKPD